MQVSNEDVLHVNARILHKNVDYLQVYLRTLNHNFSVIAISETWANNDNMSLLNIPGYNSTFKNRTSGRSGGVALFVRNCFKFTVHDDLSEFNNDYFELIFIDITNTTLGNRIIGAVYRPPGYSPDLFMIGFVKVLSAISKTRTECLIVGDFNVDLLNMMKMQIPKILLITCMNIYLSHLYLDQHDLM